MHGEAPEPPRCRELRKAGGERPHGGPVLFLASPGEREKVCHVLLRTSPDDWHPPCFPSADGQLVWSFSTKGVMLWDAASGMFLGVLQRVVVAKGGREVVADQAQAGADAMLKCRIDSSKVCWWASAASSLPLPSRHTSSPLGRALMSTPSRALS